MNAIVLHLTLRALPGEPIRQITFRIDWEPSERDALMFTGKVFEADGGDRRQSSGRPKPAACCTR